jgi:hypothetical protein
MHTKQWLATHARVKALPLSVEGHVNTLIKVKSKEKYSYVMEYQTYINILYLFRNRLMIKT